MIGSWALSCPRRCPTAKSIVLDVPGWEGSTAGQHVDVRLTAEDGYQAVRAYSLASTGPSDRVELAVDLIEDGEVSPYLVGELREGADQLELRGPLGRWFVWEAGRHPTRAACRGRFGRGALAGHLRVRMRHPPLKPSSGCWDRCAAPPRCLRHELSASLAGPNFEVTFVYTRETPPGWPHPAGRVSREILGSATIPAAVEPRRLRLRPDGLRRERRGLAGRSTTPSP